MDRRDLMSECPPPWRLDEHRMVLVCLEGDEAEFEVPAVYQVCETCDGKGSHVNPSIDAHGITAEEWSEEWDDESRQGYLAGDYDVPGLRLLHPGAGKRATVRVLRKP